MNSLSTKDWTKRLIGRSPRLPTKPEGDWRLRQRHYEQETAIQADSAAQQAAEKQDIGNSRLSNDPTAVATRRCLELGAPTPVHGQGLTSGFMDLIALEPKPRSIHRPGRAGVSSAGSTKPARCYYARLWRKWSFH